MQSKLALSLFVSLIWLCFCITRMDNGSVYVVAWSSPHKPDFSGARLCCHLIVDISYSNNKSDTILTRDCGQYKLITINAKSHAHIRKRRKTGNIYFPQSKRDWPLNIWRSGSLFVLFPLSRVSIFWFYFWVGEIIILESHNNSHKTKNCSEEAVTSHYFRYRTLALWIYCCIECAVCWFASACMFYAYILFLVWMKDNARCSTDLPMPFKMYFFSVSLSLSLSFKVYLN